MATRFEMSSRMYGVKVKDHKNYYEFGNQEHGFITLYYDSGKWTIKAGSPNFEPKDDCSWWLNGSEYIRGESIISDFPDGNKSTFTIMEQHSSEIPYKNYLYDVYFNSDENIVYGNKDVFYIITSISRIDACKISKFENGLEVSNKTITSTDILNYKVSYSDNKLPVYQNLLFDWHGTNPETGHLQMSFEIFANSNYLIYNDRHYSTYESITEFQPSSFTGIKIIDETNKNQAKKIGKDALPSIKLVKRIGNSLVCTGSVDRVSVFSDEYHDHKEVYYNGHYHRAMYLVYDNPSVDGCWMQKAGATVNNRSNKSIALTYARPFWFLMTLKNDIEYNGKVYEKQKLLKCWNPEEETVNLTLTQVESRNKFQLTKTDYNKLNYIVKTIPSEESLEIKSVIPGVGDQDSSVIYIYDTTTNFGNLTITYGDNNWTLYSTNGHIVYDKKTYGKDKAIVSFSKNDDITLTLTDNNDKYEKQKELDASYEGTVYDIIGLPDATYLTVTKQKVTEVTDAETDKTEKVYTDEEQVVINQNETPYNFFNVRFTYNSTTNKWTVYSRCRYIKYSGRNYPTGRSIVTFGTDEYDPQEEHPEIHLEIADETNKYEVKTYSTYHIQTPSIDCTTSYEVHTPQITNKNSPTLKVVKTTDGVEEPWLTVNYYDCIYEPVEVDDLAFKFTYPRTWTMCSNSDDLYYNSTNYNKGDQIATWSSDQNVTFKGININHLKKDALQIRILTKSSENTYNNQDVDETIGWYDEEDPDFNLSYNYASQTWAITAITACYSGGILYTKGQKIKTFKTGINIDQFTMMFPHTEEGSWVNITYTAEVSADIGTKITTVTIGQYGHQSESFTDKDNSNGEDETILITTEDCESMYGYIWIQSKQPVPPTVMWAVLIPISYSQGILGYTSGIKGVAQLRTRIGWLPYKEHLSTPEYFTYLGHFGTYDYYSTMDGTTPQIYHTHTHGDDWDIVDLVYGTSILVMGEFQKVICTDASHNFQIFTVDAYRATRTINNDISGILDGDWYSRDFKYYGNNRVLFYGSSSSILSYSPEYNTVLVNYSDRIADDIQDAKDTYNWSRFEPPSYIVSQQILGYEGTGVQMFIHDSLYIFYKHIYVLWAKGNTSDPEDHEERITADWGKCYYKVGPNSFTNEIVKEAAFTDFDFEMYISKPYVTQYYINNTIYLVYYDSDTGITRIVTFDPEEITFDVVKIIEPTDHITIRKLTGYDSYENYTAYFDNRPFSEEDQEIGIGSMSGELTAGRDFYIYKKISIPESNPPRNIVVAFNNIFGNASIENFMFEEDLLFNGD